MTIDILIQSLYLSLDIFVSVIYENKEDIKHLENNPLFNLAEGWGIWVQSLYHDFT